MNDIEEIKHRLNIIDVIGGYVKLQKSGANYRARCPFHQEKTPSFFVSPEKQIWHCFGGCSKGGDAFRFLMEIENIEFGEALRILAQKAGVRLKHYDKQSQDKKSLLFQINEIASLFFQKALEKSDGGKKAKEYLERRGVSNESIERFEIGYAPSSWRSLLQFLEKKGHKREDIVSAGLAVKGEGAVAYDRFRGRVMFPIMIPSGHIVGFSGRTLSESTKEAKYINSPQTIIYDKSTYLYGLYEAKEAIKKTDEAIFVEGNLDVVLSHQAGVQQAVATSGTALTLSHLRTISRYTRRITFCFDSDGAGESASKRGFELSLANNFEVNALLLLQEKDPAEFVLKNGDEAWQAHISQKIHIMEFLWNLALKTFDKTELRGKKMIADSLFHFLGSIQNYIERGHWLKEFSQRLNIHEEDFIKEFQKFERIDKQDVELYNKKDNNEKKRRISRVSQDKENLTSLSLAHPSLYEEIVGEKLVFILSQYPQTLPSNNELLLKAQVLWPTEQLARRELERILRHLSFLQKKEEALSEIKSQKSKIRSQL